MQPDLVDFSVKLEERQKIIKNVGFFSPALLLQEVLIDLTGTGTDRYSFFIIQKENFHQEWRNFFVPKIVADSIFTSSDYDQIPTFIYQEEPFQNILNRICIPLLILLGVTSMISLFTWLRYKEGLSF